MIIEISHIERAIDGKIFSIKPSSNILIKKIQTKVFDFIESRFKMKYLGRHIFNGRTSAFVETDDIKKVQKMVEIGVPIFTKLTRAKYEDIQVSEYNECRRIMEQVHQELKQYKERQNETV